MMFDSLDKTRETFMDWVRGIGEKNRREAQDKQRKTEFLRDIEQARTDLDAARHNYNFAREPALLEYYIYEIKAAETRLNYYLKLAKREGLSNERYMSGLLSGHGGRREEIT
ncbi:MAG: DUF2508 family protein [Clostridia bacterium]